MRANFSGSVFFMRLNGKSSTFVILRRVHVKRQSGIGHGTLDARQRRKFQKFFQRRRRRVFQLGKCLIAAKSPGAVCARQIPAGRLHPACADETPAAAAAFPEFKCGWSPSTTAQLEISFFQPFHFAAQTIELNMPRSGCGFSMRSVRRKIQPVQFGGQRRVFGPVNDGDLARAEFAPLPENCTDNGCMHARQKQFWPAHPR
jgi:hypothetical protein